jgi:hypothetical protein
MLLHHIFISKLSTNNNGAEMVAVITLHMN